MRLRPLRTSLLLAAAVFLYRPGAGLADEPAADSDLELMSGLLESAFDAYVDGDYDRAILHFQRVLQMNPRDKTAQKGLKQSQKMLKTKKDSVLGDEKEKIRQARKFLKNQKWLDAIDLATSVLQLNPNSREALEIHNEIAALARERMSSPKAQLGDDLVYQAMIHYLNKRYDDAIKLWREAATLRPEDFKILVYIERAEQTIKQTEKYDVLMLGRSRAKALFTSGNFAASEELWRKILTYLPDDAEARAWLEKVKNETGKVSKQSKIGDLYDKGLEYFNSGRYAESLEMWNGMLQVDPNNEVAKGYVDRIRQKQAAEKPVAPIAPPAASAPVPAVPPEPPAGTPALQQDSREEEARLKEEAQKHYMQGCLNYAEGNLDNALKEWREAIRIFPGHAPTLKMLNKISTGGQRP